MMYELFAMTLWMLAGALVAVLFFCNVEWAPIVARRMARENRFVLPGERSALRLR